MAHRRIRTKLLICVALITVIVLLLSISGIVSVNAYRSVVRTISFRAAELPLAHELIHSVDELSAAHAAWEKASQPSDASDEIAAAEQAREGFQAGLVATATALTRYRAQIEQVEPGTGISDNREELGAVQRLENILARIETRFASRAGQLRVTPSPELQEELSAIRAESAEFPRYLQRRMQDLKGNVRGKYHALIGLTWFASVLSVAMLLFLIRFFYQAVASPLSTVIHASRKIASGDFEYRVDLQTKDEMADLAAGMNEMTRQFKRIRDDLDRQVRERTKEVVRSEKLASVGFLAAGVAHEINNPLAAIAMCAESLESRLHDIIAEDDEKPDDMHNSEITVLRKYLRRIQDEAFRCKGITEKLLNYSRLGNTQRHPTDLNTIVHDVIDLLQTLGRYRERHIEFQAGSMLIARVVPEEFKQVVMNLIVNALDSVGPGGRVQIQLRQVGRQAELLVQDNGCGMTDEVQQHLFEPFFTRRRDGQGTGLGLSITYGIVVDHGGTIHAHSDGPGQGSSFTVTLPLDSHEERNQGRQAA